jgi:hypothetical protein
MPRKPVNIVLMLAQPGPVKLGDDGGDGEEVAIVEVVVIVVPVPKVDVHVRCAGLVDDAAPRGLVRGQGRRRGQEPVVEGRLEIVDNWRDEIWAPEVVSV